MTSARALHVRFVNDKLVQLCSNSTSSRKANRQRNMDDKNIYLFVFVFHRKLDLNVNAVTVRSML